VAVAGNYAYVADMYGGLRVIDISDPQSPQEVGHYDDPGHLALGVAVSGNAVYVADADSGLRVVDVSNPQSPQEIGHYETPSLAAGVTVGGGYVYVADEYAGLQIIQFDATAGSGKSPNIATRTTEVIPTIVHGVLWLPKASSFKAAQSRLLDISGRKIADLHAGANDVSRLAPGVYFVREQPQASSFKRQAIWKVVLTK
jgi:DNA-binding beta-propeller fold protein YncE